MTSPHRVPIACLTAYAVSWTLLAIAPFDRATWLLENIPSIVAVTLLVVTYRRFRYSDRAYVHGLVFLLLHTLGSYYTYSKVPLGFTMQDALGLSRNHYDRVVHFSCGLLLFLPALELVFRHRESLEPRARRWVAFAVMGFGAMAYELVEWLTAVIVDPGAGQAFLAIQGDEWDSQKDMALALAGAAIAFVQEARRERTGPPPTPDMAS